MESSKSDRYQIRTKMHQDPSITPKTREESQRSGVDDLDESLKLG